MENSVLNALRSSDVKEEDIAYLQEKFKGKFFNVEDCDRELVKLGYEPVFVVDDYEDDYEYNEDYDYDEDDYEKIYHKKHFDD